MRRYLGYAAIAAALLATAGGAAARDFSDSGSSSPTLLPTGQTITPTAAPKAVMQMLLPRLPDMPNLKAGYADSEALSPDGKTLLVLTTGYNSVVDGVGKTIPGDSTQFVFVFDVGNGTAVQKQVLQVSNSFVGIAFSPDGNSFYVPGAAEDNVHVFTRPAGGAFAEAGTPIKLGHKTGVGLGQQPLASGIAVTADGKRAVVVDKYNDSVTLLDLTARTVLGERDLRPGKNGAPAGTPGGEYPNAVAIVGNSFAYVSSERDREIVVVDIRGQSPTVLTRIAVPGNPNKMVLDKAQARLYVDNDNADVVTIIDTARNAVLGNVTTLAPQGLLPRAKTRYKGASPNGLALSPDGGTLYVTNRGTNAVAVISLTGRTPQVVGLVPTGWSPSDVRVAADGKTIYVSNAKTVPGPNPGNCLGYSTVPCPVINSPVQFSPDQYVLNITGSTLLSLPVPAPRDLARLTQQVAINDGFKGEEAFAGKMAALRRRIKHVIYIVKENRTYDQMLGDLGKGNGDPRLTEFPQTTTPNTHAIAKNFVTLDNFYDPGDVSGNGWPWSTSARESDASAKMLPPNYAGNGGGGSYDWEGTNRNINVALTGSARQAANPLTPADPDVLPGTGNVAAPDGPDGEAQQGYLWNAALRAHLSVRNYGFLIDLTRYSASTGPYQIARDRTPYANRTVQAYSANPQLSPVTDVYFRGYDTSYPDFYREQEWEREFAGYVASGNLPSLSLVRFMNDHTGNYATALDGVNRPDLEVADNDYAVGKLVETVANSRYAKDTLIFVVEDDAQDGPDHVDAHRSIALVVGPYVKKGAVVSQHYTTVNMLRTISDILGLDHLGLYDANEEPMAAVFDAPNERDARWSYTAFASSLLRSTQLPFPMDTRFAAVAPRGAPIRTAQYWVDHARGFDFSVEDKLDSAAYNKVLWVGLMGDTPYPRNGGRPVADPPAAAQPPKRDDDD